MDLFHAPDVHGHGLMPPDAGRPRQRLLDHATGSEHAWRIDRTGIARPWVTGRRPPLSYAAPGGFQ